MADSAGHRDDELCFERLTEALKEQFRQLPDKRRGKNCVYAIEDAALSAFAVFYTQSPSFLAFQRAMEHTKGKSNAQTLFGIAKIPTDNHIRDLLDAVAPQHVFASLQSLFEALDACGEVERMREAGLGQLLIALDGTQHHHSYNVSCPSCTVAKRADGKTSYSHSAITPVVVCSAQRHVIVLEPEFILPQDGHDKQDCETAAAKRWLATFGERYRGRKVTVLGDDLYSRQPMCEQILAFGMNFILVCKASSHPTLYEWLDGLAHCGAVHTHAVSRRHGKKVFTDTYRFAAQVPLREGQDALLVNWCELTTTDAAGKVLYHNAFVTAHPIERSNVAALVQAGRARWQIENGNNNTLKTKGYNFEHNFGHGKMHLSALLATLNLLAFLLHTAQNLCTRKVQVLRAALGTRRNFFEHVRALTCYHCFDSYQALLDFMLQGLEIELADTS